MRHSIEDEDYFKTINSNSILLYRVQQIVEYVKEFPEDFIKDLNLNAIILIQSS